jgi:hypothetical protein
MRLGDRLTPAATSGHGLGTRIATLERKREGDLKSMSGLIGAILLLAYGVGGWKFWAGFRRTNFSQGRLRLTLLWPLLLVINKSYRQNFNKALKG